MTRLRVGVVFGGRSGEHEVSLASAASVIAALERGGHAVVPIGIARDGRWVVGGDPLRALAGEARMALPSADPTGAVKKALADRAEAVEAAADTAVARVDASAGLPPEIRRTVDVVMIMLHGPYGEDGTIQGLLELADIPYTGAGVLASAVGMDKVTMKTVFRAHGLPIVDHVVVERREWRRDPAAVTRRIAEGTGLPCFVKPSNLGSSVGISKVRTLGALPAALDEAARHDRRIVVERAVQAREIEVSVLGNDDPITSLPGEIVYESEWYDYTTKYAEGQASLVVPAAIPPAVTQRIRDVAVAAYRAIDCAGMARVDFFLEGDRVWLNEINTIPGFTSTSGYARMWEATGLDYVTLVSRLLHLALERHLEKMGGSPRPSPLPTGPPLGPRNAPAKPWRPSNPGTDSA
jgi:D-alanine-D-alanine ligase